MSIPVSGRKNRPWHGLAAHDYHFSHVKVGYVYGRPMKYIFWSEDLYSVVYLEKDMGPYDIYIRAYVHSRSAKGHLSKGIVYKILHP